MSDERDYDAEAQDYADRYEDEEGRTRWAGMGDGDTQSVRTPFGEAIFQLDRGDPSVGLNGGVFVVGLEVEGVEFHRDQLEKVIAVQNGVTYNLAERLDRWAEGE